MNKMSHKKMEKYWYIVIAFGFFILFVMIMVILIFTLPSGGSSVVVQERKIPEKKTDDEVDMSKITPDEKTASQGISKNKKPGCGCKG